MIQWFRRSLKRKITFMLIAATLIPVLFLGLFSYYIASNLTEEKTKGSGMNLMEQMGTNLEFYMQDIRNMSLFLIGNKDISAYLNASKEEAHWEQTRMIEFITNLVYTKKYISDITIYPVSEAIPISNTTIFQTDLPDITTQHTDYFSSYPYWWTPVYSIHTAAGQRKVISLVRPIRNFSSFKHVGKLVISLDESVISTMLDKSDIADKGFILLADEHGQVISSSLASSPETVSSVLPGLQPMNSISGSFNYGPSHNKQTILYRTVADSNWKLIGVIPFAEYSSQNRYVLMLTVLALTLALSAIVVLVTFFVQRLTRPLRMLSAFLKNIKTDEPMQVYPVESMDEVGQLVRSYNQLSGRIERLTDEVKREEALRTEADMQALQSQIKPHFLYNTLSSIHWMALMNKDNSTANMVANLSDFLRFSLNNGAQMTTVEQELAHVRHYMNIQEIRYPNQFETVYAVDAQVLRMKMVKLLLQPLIENALVHGLQKKGGRGALSIRISQQSNEIMFTVEDSGVGIEPHKLQAIRSRIDEIEGSDARAGEHFGLRNVNRRLLLHYGIDAGLKIESETGMGTRVSFTLPIMEGHIDEGIDRR